MVTTVTGSVAPEELGVTLAHEHLFIDLRNQFTPFADPEKARVSRQRVRMSHLGRLRRNPYALRDNLGLDDLDLATAEAGYFQAAGGGTIVDCTSIGIGRDPLKLRALAERTGLNIIAGCGYYTQDTHPRDMGARRPQEIAAEMVRDLTMGIGDTGIRAGVIGEVGTSNPIHPDEIKNLHAAALAWADVPVPIHVHTFPWGRAGLEATRVLSEHGVDPARIVICHVDVEPDMAYMRELLALGVVLEFDNFGKEFWIDPADRGFAGGVFVRDIDRVRCLRALLDAGYGRQLLITTDICLKSLLRHYGGWGYDHIPCNVVPMLRHEGIPEAAIQDLLVGNPRRLFGGPGLST